MSDVDPVLESKDWKAWEDRKGPVSLHVTGTVVVRATNYKARLEKASPQGINPKILLLNLIVESTGPVGGDAITPIPAKYAQEKYMSGTYEQVTILRQGNGGAHIPKIETTR